MRRSRLSASPPFIRSACITKAGPTVGKWKEMLAPEFEKPYFKKLERFLDNVRVTFFPPPPPPSPFAPFSISVPLCCFPLLRHTTPRLPCIQRDDSLTPIPFRSARSSLLSLLSPGTQERRAHGSDRIFPPEVDIFNAFNMTPFEQVRRSPVGGRGGDQTSADPFAPPPSTPPAIPCREKGGV